MVEMVEMMEIENRQDESDKHFDVITQIRQNLSQQVDERTKSGAASYFKEPITFYGVRTAVVNQIARQSFQTVKDLEKDQILDLSETLLKSDYNEEAFIAFDWSYRLKKLYQPADFFRFEKWVDIYVNNWAKCDTLCNHTVGALVEMYPAFLVDLKRWARSSNRWLRRASAVSLIVPARKGLFLDDVFQIADILLLDKDDLVQKGYGWMLKEASKSHLGEVIDYLKRNESCMPRTALRYAIEKMPEDLQRQFVRKRA